MNPKLKRQTNRLQFAALLRWVVITVFVGTAGLSYVYLKNQLHDLGNQRKKMEQELRDLVAQNNTLESQISRLTSYTALQRRVDDGFLKLMPINDHAVVHVRSQESTRWIAADSSLGNHFQTVSHETSSR